MYRNLPNLLTLLRLVLAGVFFVVLNQYRYEFPRGEPHTAIIFCSIVLFSLAAITDVLDGYLARKWHVESRFGRIMDPFCDKILVIGAFMMLAGPRFIIPDKPPNPLLSLNMVSGVYPWMVVIILARELLVTGIRGEMEGQGTRFGANLFGKLKMILQSLVIPLVLLLVWIDPVQHKWAGWTRDVLVYATILVTVLSGWPYIVAARKSMKQVEPAP
jgi:CDP-diacylglycerol---glycerol-3-phosphate 3-phosphatidyltransferase